MERDLATLRAKRAEREKAAGALRLHDCTQERELVDEDLCAATDGGLAVDDHSVVTDGPPQDTTQGSAIDDKAAPAIKSEMPFLVLNEARTVKDELGTINEHPSGDKLPKTFKSNPAAEAKDAVRIPSPDFDADLPDTQNTGQLSGADFDSMFAETSAPNNNHSFNFDLDFSGDANMSLHDDPFGNLDASHDFTNTSAENIDSLMPGIENYVNESSGVNVNDGYMTLEMPATSTALDSSLSTKHIQDGEIDFSGIDAATEPTLIQTAPTTSNFDDLFFDDTGGLDMGGGDVTGEFVDFDDNWFKSDGQ